MIFGKDYNFQYYSVDDESTEIASQKQSLFGDDSNFTYYPISIDNNSTIFGADESFVCSLVNQNSLQAFGNDNDFLNLNNYEQSNITAENHRDCGLIDIGNNYGAYEINRDCGYNNRLYKRYCPCNDEHKNDCYKPCNDCNKNKCNDYCNDKHCSNDCEKPDCNKQNCQAEKLSNKIYLQFVEIGKLLSYLINMTNCPIKAKQLYNCKTDIDKLTLSSLALSKAICFCEPIKAHYFDQECKYNIIFAKILTTMSCIIEDLVKLQNIVNNKVICASIMLLLTHTISVNNNLLQIACFND